jgi:vesicle transport protein SEC22
LDLGIYYLFYSNLKICQLSYIIEGSVCYLCICDQSYPRKLAFSYLEELAKEFNMSYGNEVDKPGLRPYAFVKFGKEKSNRKKK